jgi:hypothetical protein
MASSEREARAPVIKARRRPRDRSVTGATIGTEPPGMWIIPAMTGHTIRRGIAESWSGMTC